MKNKFLVTSNNLIVSLGVPKLVTSGFIQNDKQSYLVIEKLGNSLLDQMMLFGDQY